MALRFFLSLVCRHHLQDQPHCAANISARKNPRTITSLCLALPTAGMGIGFFSIGVWSLLAYSSGSIELDRRTNLATVRAKPPFYRLKLQACRYRRWTKRRSNRSLTRGASDWSAMAARISLMRCGLSRRPSRSSSRHQPVPRLLGLLRRRRSRAFRRQFKAASVSSVLLIIKLQRIGVATFVPAAEMQERPIFRSVRATARQSSPSPRTK